MTLNKTARGTEMVDPTVNVKWAFLKPETQFFLSKTITHPAMKETLDAIRSTHSMSGEQATGMLLLGETGVGKTTTLNKYVKSFEANYGNKETETLTKWPIIHIRIPSKPTPKSLIQKILSSVSHATVKLEGTQGKLEGRLDKLIKNQHVELIIFDEFQHLLKEQALKSTRDVANLIKNIMEEHKLAIVMAGTPEGLDSISQHDELYERFTFEQITLSSFKIKDKEDSDQFIAYIKTCVKILEKADVKSIKLTSPLMTKRIYLATGGKARLITRLFIKVLESTDLSHRITLNDFQQAYQKRPLNSKLKLFNPFAAGKAALDKKLEDYK